MPAAALNVIQGGGQRKPLSIIEEKEKDEEKEKEGEEKKRGREGGKDGCGGKDGAGEEEREQGRKGEG